MHVSALEPSRFSITVNGREAQFSDIFPNFTDFDRVGVVVRSPYGGLGASYLITRAIVEFYQQREAIGEVYPDNYLFAVGGPQGDHSMLDIWPEHHFVEVPDDAELILQAINDRGITRLLVEAGTRAAPMLANWTEQSALARITTALVYEPSGRIDGADVSISADDHVEHEVGLQLDPPRIIAESEGYDDFLAYYANHQNDVSAEETDRQRIARSHSLDSGRRTETYRFVETAEALSLLGR